MLTSCLALPFWLCVRGKTYPKVVVGELVVSKAGQGGVSIVDADLRFGAGPSLGSGRFTLRESRQWGKLKSADSVYLVRGVV